jgi:hypothetical protein
LEYYHMRISATHNAIFSGKTIVRNGKPCRAPTGKPGQEADVILKAAGTAGITFESYMAQLGGSDSGRGIRRLHVLKAAGAIDLVDTKPAKPKAPRKARKAKVVEVAAVEAAVEPASE